MPNLVNLNFLLLVFETQEFIVGVKCIVKFLLNMYQVKLS